MRPLFVRLFTAIGFLSLLSVFILLFTMLHPSDIAGIGKIGLFTFMLIPQFLLLAVMTALLSYFSSHLGARWAKRCFAFVSALTAIMALWPTMSLSRRAHQYNVPISIMAMMKPVVNGGGPHSEKTVTYAVSSDGIPLLLDVWHAKNIPENQMRPAIIRIHGGGWNHGTRGEMGRWNQWFNDLGYDVFDIDYRMPPPVRWLDEVGDVKCAIGWVAANTDKYHIDTERISLMGYSAGGNLALLAGYSTGDVALPPSCHATEIKIHSVINLYGPSDIAIGYVDTASPRYVHPLMHNYIGGPPFGQFLERYKLLSPATHVTADVPPTITLQGETDRVVNVGQALILDKALANAGVAHETYFLPWTDHGFDASWNSLAAQIARAKIKEFLKKYS